jgi:hypothetical protein
MVLPPPRVTVSTELPKLSRVFFCPLSVKHNIKSREATGVDHLSSDENSVRHYVEGKKFN